jgi:diaminopimelate decarboxylase
MHHFVYRQGTLHAEEVSLADVAASVGTPFYCYSAATLERHIRVFADAFAGSQSLVCYSVKANSNLGVLATLARQGAGMDVVSEGELRRALAVGVPPDKIVFSGVGKTAEEMRLALEGGLCQFNLESLDEARMLSEVAIALGREAPAAFRINPDVEAGSHAKISTGAAHNKFGLPIGNAAAAYDRARNLPGLDLRGVAVHIGSQLTSLDPLERAFAKIGDLIRDLRGDGHSIATADLGGGLGVPYDPAEPLPPSPADYAAMVRRVTERWDVRLIFEPGRLIVGNAGILLTRVIRVKPGLLHPFVIVDAGMNDLMRPTLYDAWHAIDAVAPTGERRVANVVGPVCETGDTFAMGRDMDRVEADDLLFFRTAGAYAATMASTYNSRPLTPEVLVDGDRWAVVRERIDVQALIKADSIPYWLQP